MSFPGYKYHKESGIEWLGDVPAHWGLMPLKRDLSLLTSGSRGWAEHYAEEGDLFIRIGNLTRDSTALDLSDMQRVSIPEGSEGERTRVQPGDLLFSITAYLGSVAVVPLGIEAAYVSQHVALARLRQRSLLPEWVGLVTLSSIGKTYLETQGYGGTKIQLALDDVANLLMTVPPIDEQRRIVAVVEYEAAKINALIEEQRRLLALLKEKRQAVISHAVTKGLDPYAPIKDSGAEWLGEVPAHWDVKQLKRAVVLQRGHDLPTDERVDGSFPVISSGGTSGYHNQAITSAPTIVTGRYGSIGDFHLVDQPCWPLNTALYSVETYENILKFLWYMLQAHCEHFILNSMKSAVPGVDRNDVHPVLVALPPTNEQRDIVAQLDGQLSKFDGLANEVSLAIILLQERRSALMSAAVTGKIDVRGLIAAEKTAA
jgi:type I restriction enzyme, S subunit